MCTANLRRWKIISGQVGLQESERRLEHMSRARAHMFVLPSTAAGAAGAAWILLPATRRPRLHRSQQCPAPSFNGESIAWCSEIARQHHDNCLSKISLQQLGRPVSSSCHLLSAEIDAHWVLQADSQHWNSSSPRAADLSAMLDVLRSKVRASLSSIMPL